MAPFAIGALQLALDNGDNLAAIGEAIAATLARNPEIRMVVLPELAAFGHAVSKAEPLPGPAERYFVSLAIRHRVWLVTGSLYERDGDRVYNTASAIAPDGRVVARHRKLYPFLPYETGVAAGRDITVFDIPGACRFGLSICYDGWFPEVARAMAWQGAEVMLLPSMTNTMDRPQELILAQAQAIGNQCVVVNVNIAGTLGRGQSIVVGPEGEVMHQAGTDDEALVVQVDLERLREVRRRGTLGLGQVLKSFRDGRREWPCYLEGSDVPPQMRAMGPLWPA
jgi:predicted amidohydrolase